LRCEVCGHKIYGNSYKVIIEGARLTVCSQCSKHGKLVWEEPTPKTLKPRPKTPLASKIQSKNQPETLMDTSLELIENFDVKIKQAREKLRLSHEDIGKKINEKVSVLKKIETGKIVPNNKLTAKLEHALKIKLLVPASKEKIPQTKTIKTVSRELTLGDLIQLNKKEKEEPAERKLS